ncbi:MAG: ABC-2 transporter permease [Clostridia bacterium]|nr:ABC-2 transporter permease [Clostridia bacterium]
MIPLMHKELRLALHPTMLIFLLLSGMLCIPSYPYYVVFFYTAMGVFYTCTWGRENQDVFYTLMLPVKKTDVVDARFGTVILFELLQLLVAIPFAVLRQTVIGAQNPSNPVGMDANLALFAFALLLYAAFNWAFMGVYYRDVRKVGKAFVIGSIAMFALMLVLEMLVHVVPFMRDVLDTPDTAYVGEKLIVLAVCAAVFVLVNLAALRRARRNFVKQDL